MILAALPSSPAWPAVRDAARDADAPGRVEPTVLSAGLEDFIPMFAGHPYLVLGSYTAREDDTFPEDAWAVGPVRVEWTQGSFRRLNSRAVDAQRVPAAIRAWRGRKLALFGVGGRRCLTTITGLRIASQVLNTAEGAPSGREELPAADWERVDDHYQMRELRPHVLLAEVDYLPSCRGAAWGRPVERPVPRVVRARDPSPALRRAALAAFRKLPEYQTLQASFVGQRPADGPRFWDENQAASSAQRNLRWFPPSRGRAGLIVVSASSMNCGEGFEGHLYAIFAIDPATRMRPRLRLRARGTLDFFSPESSFDIDGDGRPEFLDGDTLVRWRGDGYQQQSLPEPFLDPC